MNILKKQSVAWVITAVMVVAAIVIGLAKAPAVPTPEGPGGSYSDGSDSWYVYDDADVLDSDTERALRERNRQLYERMDVVIACVTTNYGGDGLGSFALDYAETIGLGPNDFIVVLDISGENYWLIQGSGLTDLFSDDDCQAYAWDYMEGAFAQGDYGAALLNLTQALADWYAGHYLT